MPCGLVYAALLKAAETANPASGAVDGNRSRTGRHLSATVVGNGESLSTGIVDESQPGRGLADSKVGGILRAQNRKRRINCTERAPPLWKMGVRPLPGLPVPNIRLSIEGDWPNNGLDRKRVGSAKLGWLNRLNASIRSSSARCSLNWKRRRTARSV
ncbi:MAG: sulfite exporter TauE/SafE family protein [bacterium]|nr:sulfite exporter TauE/SafE family protein [bacterium]